MESQRSFLVIGLLVVSYLLWNQWQTDYGPQSEPSQPVQQQISDQPSVPSTPIGNPGATTESTDIPSALNTAAPVLASQPNQNKVIEVNTDTLALNINLVGGDVIAADLLQHALQQKSEQPFPLLQPMGQELYIAQSGLVGDGPDANKQGRPLYQSVQSSYQLEGDSLSVPLVWQNDQLKITKTFVFTKNSNAIQVDYQVTNLSQQNKQITPYAQLKQSMAERDGSVFMPTYRGSAYSTQEERYEKYSFSDIQDERLQLTTQGGWVAMLQHYFVSAWVPPQNESNTLYTRNLQDQIAIIGYTGQSLNVAPGQTTEINNTLYLGAKDQDALAAIAPNLDLTVDYGILWWISQPLFALLKLIHSLVGNWGFSIVIITLIVKGVMYPLTKAQYESMAKMRALAPKMQSLKERYGDDRQKMSQGMMDLYRKEKVNPMGGCLPLLLQMPIFMALYFVLLESVELRHADFVLWITDLSVKDPYFVLPILTGVSMYLLQRLQPMTMTDPMQQKIMQWMPVAMSLFFFIFPAGLVLYWLVSNLITLAQAKLIYRSMDKRGIKRS